MQSMAQVGSLSRSSVTFIRACTIGTIGMPLAYHCQRVDLLDVGLGLGVEGRPGAAPARQPAPAPAPRPVATRAAQAALLALGRARRRPLQAEVNI